MNVNISTESLMHKLLKTSSLSRFVGQNEKYFESEDLAGCLDRMCEECGLSVSGAIRAAQIERCYGYQIFRGIRSPSRDKLLQLALGMRLDVKKTQHLLTVGGKAVLYPKLKRDAVLLYCISHSLSVPDTQEILVKYGLSMLGGTEK